MTPPARAQALAAPLMCLALLLAGPVAPATARRVLEAPGAAPGTAPGRSAAGAQGRACTIELAAVGPVTGGQPLTLSGTLDCASPAAGEGQTLTVEQHLAGTPGFAPVGTVTTGTGGAFSFTTPEGLVGDSVFSIRAANARSAREPVRVPAAVTLAGPPTGSRLAPAGHASGGAGEEVVLSGTVSDAAAGAIVVLQRESETAAGDWRRIGVGSVGVGGRYTIAHRFGSPGTVTLRAVVRGHGMRATASALLSYEVEPRQNPGLTLESSAMTIEYGMQVTLGGVAALDRGAPLELLARTRGQRFHVIATTTSGPQGEYSFAPQAPVESTRFRVRGARGRSVALPVQVQGRLALSAPPTGALSGEALSFCGTLSPAYAGERVYLQRQLAGGLAFHTVAEQVLGPSTAASQASFCLQTAAGVAGSEVFRLKVPRGEGEQASASEALDVDVGPST